METERAAASEGPDYKATMKLPATDFPMRANSAQREPAFIERWESQGLYAKLQAKRAEAPLFLLHDGPPYLSSPNIHLGHALNRVMKDLVVKSQAMRGKRAPFVPGYDCHGLPIENAVLRNVEGGRSAMSPLALRQRCAEFARANLAGQQAKFRRLGILADWEHPYLTMDPAFEAKQIGVFGEMMRRGYIYRGLKPVHWCPTCETALAEAEVEHDDHISTAIHVKFMLKATSQAMMGKLARFSEPVYLVIWTTTPWTLPANTGIAVHPKLHYVVLKTDKHGLCMVAKELQAAFLEATEMSGEVVAELSGMELVQLQAQHPFIPLRTSQIVLGDHVTAEAGTGLVHTAPGHGLEDYEVGRKFGLPVLAPVDSRGVFTAEAGSLVEGLRYTKGNEVIIERLKDSGALVHAAALQHSYPHCWRCHKPVIFRATEQWFASVEGFRQEALSAIEGVRWVPAVGEKRIANMVAGRSDWCISRQRSWGVPIPVFYCQADGEVLATPETIGHVQSRIEQEGSDLWWKLEAHELLPEGTSCAKCGGKAFRKESDIMDVWFDSGSSHTSVLEARPGLGWPADLYMEGTDQYRGWFQSSLLTAVATKGHAPYRTVVTHGFTVDEAGRKMSKSIGNVIEPAKVIEQYGADVLRLWVASVDYTGDVRVSDNILKQLSDVYRKLRNTARYMLSVLGDFDPATQMVAHADMDALDQHTLARFAHLVQTVSEELDRFEFAKVVQALQSYASVELSSFAFDVQKDVLYADPEGSPRRRSAQSAMAQVLVGFTKLLAPITSTLAEDIWDHLPEALKEGAMSVFLADWPAPPAAWSDPEVIAAWAPVQAWRDVALRELEAARKDKRIGASQAASLTFQVPNPALLAHLQALGTTRIAQLTLTSSVRLEAKAPPPPAEGEAAAEGWSVEGLEVLVGPAEGEKCARCWNHRPDVGAHEAHPHLCGRCVEAVSSLAG